MDIVVAQKSLDQRKDRQARYDLSCTQDRKATSIHLQLAYLVMSLNHRYLTTLCQSLDTTDLGTSLASCPLNLQDPTPPVHLQGSCLCMLAASFWPSGGGRAAPNSFSQRPEQPSRSGS
jgi:hypothetical protein